MMRMAFRRPDKRRFSEAIRRRPYREIPYFETEFSPGIVSAILGTKFETRSYALPPDMYVKLLELTGIDLAYLGVAWTFGRKEHVDESGTRHYIDGTIKQRSDLVRLAPPGLDPINRRIEEILEAAHGTKIGWMYALPSPEDIVTAVGLQDLYIKLYDDSSFIEELLDRYQDYSLRVTELILGYEPDAVMMASGICHKTGLFMRPDHAERFVFSRMERQMALVRESGVPAVIHCDGDNSPVMETWIRLGFSGLHPVEPCGAFDIYAVKERWGNRIALFGNIDVAGVLTRGSPDEVYRNTTLHCERLGRDGGYVCGSSHDIGDNVPLENLRAMIEAVCTFENNGPGA